MPDWPERLYERAPSRCETIDLELEPIEAVSMATAAPQDIAGMATKLSHSDRVEFNINSENLLSEPEEIFGSGRRCLVDYRVDAKSFSEPVLTRRSANTSNPT